MTNQLREVVADALPGVEQQARELLAAEFEHDNYDHLASEVRAGKNGTIRTERALRAIKSALTITLETPDGLPLLPVASGWMHVDAPEYESPVYTAEQMRAYAAAAIRTPANTANIVTEDSVTWDYNGQKIGVVFNAGMVGLVISEGTRLAYLGADTPIPPASEVDGGRVDTSLIETAIGTMQMSLDAQTGARVTLHRTRAGQVLEALRSLTTPPTQQEAPTDERGRPMTYWGGKAGQQEARAVVTGEMADAVLTRYVGICIDQHHDDAPRECRVEAMRVALTEHFTPPRHPTDEGAVDVLCIHCGRPTMHIGNVCFACSKANKAAAEPSP